MHFAASRCESEQRRLQNVQVWGNNNFAELRMTEIKELLLINLWTENFAIKDVTQLSTCFEQ